MGESEPVRYRVILIATYGVGCGFVQQRHHWGVGLIRVMQEYIAALLEHNKGIGFGSQALLNQGLRVGISDRVYPHQPMR